MKKLVIGLTGGIGSGKTTIANMFSALGITLIDADIIAREVVEPHSYALEKIKQHFGGNYIQSDGNLDRSKLRQKIFNSDSDKQWLNDLLHPIIRKSILSHIEKSTDKYCILVAPLLFENKLVHLVNRTLVIDVKESTQIERTIKRDNNEKALIEKIIASQISRSERLKNADDVINNSSNDLKIISEQVKVLHETYLALAR